MNTQEIDWILWVIIRKLYFILVHSWKSLQVFNHGMMTFVQSLITLDAVCAIEYQSQRGCWETSHEADAEIQEKDDDDDLAQGGSIGNKSF